MVRFTDFDHFPPDQYLQEYYAELDQENRFLLSFFAKVLKNISVKTAADAGSGPAVYQLISTAQHAEIIHIYEYNEDNRNEVRKWLRDEPGSFNWNPYMEFVSELEKKNPVQLEAAVKEKVKDIRPVNLLSPDFEVPETYELTGSHFCAESITTDRDQFHLAVRNIIKFLRPGGILMMSLLKGAVSYRAGSSKFPAYPVNEAGIKSILETEGITLTDMETVAASHGRDYEGIICLCGRKN